MALDILSGLLGFKVAIQYLKNNTALFTEIYTLTASEYQKIRYQVMMYFVWLCQTLSSSFTIISKAAKNHAKRSSKSHFIELIETLNKKNDEQLRYSSLLLINSIIVKSPAEKKTAKFLTHLENLGLYDELRILSHEKSNEKILKQLMNFQISTRQIFPGMSFEVAIHKARV